MSRTEEELPRTQNAVEAWHRRIKELMGSHSSLFTAIKELNKEKKAVSIKIRKVGKCEERKPMREEYEEKEANIKDVISKRLTQSVPTYLTSIADSLYRYINL